MFMDMKAAELHEARIDPPPGAGGSAWARARSGSARTSSIGLLMASSLTLVGLTRVSIGPAISVMLRGCAVLPDWAMTAAAASTCTQGWQTATTCARSPSVSSQLMRCVDVVVEPEAAVVDAHVARIVPIGYADIVVRQQRAHQTAQQCGKVPRERRHHQNLRLRDVHILLEAQQRAEGRHIERLLAHGDLAIAHADAVDAVGRARMREAGARYQLVGGREIAQDFEVLAQRPRGPAR